jgi:hypothetical protein
MSARLNLFVMVTVPAEPLNAERHTDHMNIMRIVQ